MQMLLTGRPPIGGRNRDEALLNAVRGRTEEALALYESAVDHAFDPDVAAVGRLGSATCLERLGDLAQALAELDEAELPPEVFSSRSEGLKARGSIR